MPREVHTVADLTPEELTRHLREELQKSERAKNPGALSIPERITRIEIILGID